MFLRTLLLLALAGCGWTPEITDTHWKVAEHMCRNNEGVDRIIITATVAHAVTKLQVHCKNGMQGQVNVIPKPTEASNG
jgi:hypothetical protein